MKKGFMNVGLILFAGFCLVCLGSSVSYGQLVGLYGNGLYGGLYGDNITSGGQITNPVDAILINPQPEPPRYIATPPKQTIESPKLTGLDWILINPQPEPPILRSILPSVIVLP